MEDVMAHRALKIAERRAISRYSDPFRGARRLEMDCGVGAESERL